MKAFGHHLESVQSIIFAVYEGFLVGMISIKVWAVVSILIFKSAFVGLLLIVSAIHLS